MTEREPPFASLDEPLAESAPLAWEWSRRHCRQQSGVDPGCAWYHGAWQTLRLLGVFHSIRSDDDFFLPTLADLIARGARRVLVSGAADYALLARIAAARDGHPVEVTVVDRCATALRLNQWYGERVGVAVRGVQKDVLDYDPGAPFDVVCTHSFICFFDPPGRRALIGRWRGLLRPGGAVVTAQRARTLDRDPVIRYPAVAVAALGERAAGLAQDSFARLGVDPGHARRLAEGYASHHWTYLVRTPEELRALFEDGGFRLEVFAPPGAGQPVADTPGTPNEGGSLRWRILARLPG